MNTVERARGRWREILSQHGVDARFLRNRHGPCPICGGKDRFRFDDRDGSGSYFCDQCGAGTGIILIRKFKSWDRATACAEVDKIIGTDWKPAATVPNRQNDDASRLDAIERLLAAANSPDVVTAYLRRRGLSATSRVLRGHSHCPYFADHGFVGGYPAVVAPIFGRTAACGAPCASTMRMSKAAKAHATGRHHQQLRRQAARAGRGRAWRRRGRRDRARRAPAVPYAGVGGAEWKAKHREFSVALEYGKAPADVS